VLENKGLRKNCGTRKHEAINLHDEDNHIKMNEIRMTEK